MKPAIPALIGQAIFFVLLYLLITSSSAFAWDAPSLARFRAVYEPLVIPEGDCSHITYHLNADRAIERAFPSAFGYAAAMATDDDPRNAEPCTAWFRSAEVTRRTYVHELLHTAGYHHGAVMRARLRALLKTPAHPLNRSARAGSLRGMKIKKPQQPKVRSHVAVDAHMRNSAGAMGKAKRAARRSDRQNTKRALRAGSEA